MSAKELERECGCHWIDGWPNYAPHVVECHRHRKERVAREHILGCCKCNEDAAALLQRFDGEVEHELSWDEMWKAIKRAR